MAEWYWYVAVVALCGGGWLASRWIDRWHARRMAAIQREIDAVKRAAVDNQSGI